jgi:hypothetical protein
VSSFYVLLALCGVVWCGVVWCGVVWCCRTGACRYVPFDWGHSAVNLEPLVFGYTMELINRRDTFMTVLGKSC